MSTHRVDVIRVNELESHPNADRLKIVRPFGFQVCVGYNEFQIGDLAAYIPPDSMVDTNRKEFSFLKHEGRDLERIKVKRLRGFYSQGLLVKAPDGLAENDDAAEILGVSHYEPPATQADSEPGPLGIHTPIYDVENYRRYKHVLLPDEQLIVTEKLHGTNTRVLFHQDRLWVGSHRQWKREGDNVFWRAVNSNQGLIDFVKENPGIVAYCEVYGWVQDLRYGKRPNEVSIAVYDLWDGRGSYFWNWDQCLNVKERLPWVPVLGVVTPQIGEEAILKLSEGNSCIVGVDHVREGCVLRPSVERFNEEIKRVILKIINNAYLERA